MRKVNPKRTEERLTKQEAESLIREIKDFMEYVDTNATEVSKTNVYKSSAQFLNMQLRGDKPMFHSDYIMIMRAISEVRARKLGYITDKVEKKEDTEVEEETEVND